MTARMHRRIALAFLAALTALAATNHPAAADGALAVGNCGAYGWARNYDSEAEARDNALKECRSRGGKNCRVVVALKGNCAAFATDRRRACGAWGWASRPTQDLADDAALSECRGGGGRNCAVRAQVCDSKTAAAPAMTTNWTSTTLDQDECLKRAERVMRDAGLTTNFEVAGQSVFGEKGNFTAQVRCIAPKGVVVFVVVGPELVDARKHMSELFDRF